MCVVAGGQVTARSTAEVRTTVSAHWRGAYDLLVTADGALSDAAAQTDGLIEQNFASLTGHGGIGAAQLAAIRAVPGVDVAAPLAFVGALSSPAYGLLVGATEPRGATADFFSRARAFDVRVMVTVDDGVDTQLVQDTSATFVTGQASGAPVSALVKDVAGLYASASTSGDGTWGADLTMPAVPELSAGVVAVDPAAERVLLGEHGVFLDGLLQFDREQTAKNRPEVLAGLVEAAEHDYEHWTLATGYVEGPVVPVVVSDSAYPALRARVTVTPVTLDSGSDASIIDPETGTLDAAVEAAVAAAPRAEPVSSDVDLTAGLTAFALPSLTVPLPGATAPPGGTAMQTTPTLTPSLVGRAQRTAPTDAQAREAPRGVQTALVAVPQGVVALSSTAAEQTYRQAATGPLAPSGTPLYAPVGTYHPGDVTGTAADASYVPLGTYSASQVTVVQPGPHEGARLAPSFSGRGAVLPSPGAITTLTGLRALGGSGSADVVRVRVAGISEYSPAAMDAIGDVAARIADLGLDVRVVAGSSLAPVGVYLPEFSAAGDLGWTTEEWTSLGAAVRVEQARLGATAALLAVTLAGVGLMAAVMLLAGVERRRREAALLTSLGWGHRRVRRWFLAEDAPALGVVALACAVATIGAETALARVTVLIVLAVYAVAAVIGVRRVTADPRPRRAPRPATRPARTPGQVGRRIARAHPGTSALAGVAVVVLTAGAVAFVGVLTTAQLAAGTTRLAALVDHRLLLPQAVLAIGALVAGVTMLVAGLRTALTASAVQHAMLTAAGWDRTTLARAVRAQLMAALTPGVLMAVATGALVAATLDAGPTGRLVVLSVLTPILPVTAALAWAGRHARSTTTGVAR